MTKRTFRKHVTAALAAIGYAEMPRQPMAGMIGFFKLVDRYVLMVGVQFSSLYKDQVSVLFYLSTTFQFSLVLRDFPHDAYEGVGAFLSPEEKVAVGAGGRAPPDSEDIWWEGFSDATVARVAKAVAITEPRFLAQEGLFRKLDASSELASYRRKLEAIIASWKASHDPLDYESALRHTEDFFRRTTDISRSPRRRSSAMRWTRGC